ncbi:E3 ubiquitin-protein ligase MIB2-like isoform X2 [Mya arenaria]|uniref:E3 ubiquitin-protein ligase MIB2-like isoform X2 n=1 Tax=Mya arenaria TaxID=6604 RepID=UPI0022E7C10C|nr:E3 ubiquitin-protein ligase MIB2-like isoform X2 [Mya arenaria]
MRPGIRVLRGPDWRYGDQDGGPGYLGTVTKIYPDNTVQVRWDVGTETTCRAGRDDAFDLRLYDNAQIGVLNVLVTCNACSVRPVAGLRWKCLVCRNVDYCTECYMNGEVKDCLVHSFVRFTTTDSLVVRVPQRKRSKKIPLYGIFPGATVAKIAASGSDEEKVGEVKELVDRPPESWRGAVRVEWEGVAPRKNDDGEPEFPVYRLGADGAADVRLVKAKSPGKVYIDHLPVLDLTMPVDIHLCEGDRVRMDLNLDTFKPLLSEHGGWIPELEKVLGEEGVVERVKDRSRRIVSVRYDTPNCKMTIQAMYMNVLTKISTIKAGLVVKVTTDQNKMKKLQSGHGGWQDAYVSILGQTGRVVRVDDSTDAVVEIQGQMFLLNPACLEDSTSSQTSRTQSPPRPARSLSNSFRMRSRLIVPAAARMKPTPGISMDVGVRVVRGPDWSPDFENQDGGEGGVGTVVEICGVQDAGTYPRDCVVVQWDAGERNVYRVGYENAFDLRLYDNAGIGVKHAVRCSGCDIDGIFGLLWTCVECPDVRLCSECYNKDKHDVQHHFTRYDNPESQGKRVPKRGMSKRVMSTGIFEESKVRRGPDWRWHDQDGGEDKHGQVIAVVNFSPDTDRDAAEVTWSNGYTNVYRLGYHGRLDVIGDKCSQGGTYYRDHLPILKLTPAPAKTAPSVTEPGKSAETGGASLNFGGDGIGEAAGGVASGGVAAPSRFKEGSKVKITIDVDVLKLIEDNKGAWNDRMAECIGRTGTVVVARGNDITVDFEMAGKWSFDESVLTEVHSYSPGEVVKVNDNQQNVRMLQTERGGWNDLMSKVVGRKGTVEEIDEDGDVVVSFGEYTWTMNAECLAPYAGNADHVKYSDAPRVESDHPPLPGATLTEGQKQEMLIEKIKAGDTKGVNELIQRDPHHLLMEINGQFPVFVASMLGQTDIIRDMFRCASKEALLEFNDGSEKMTPLLQAIKSGQVETVRFLVQEGANISACNHNNQSAVHLAVSSGSEDMLRALLDMKFDINIRDALDQTPLFDAILAAPEALLGVLLERPELEVDYEDKLHFTPFLVACRKGHLGAIKAILDRKPTLVSSLKKDDGYTGLHLAAFNGNKEAVDFLLGQRRTEINARTDDGKTAVQLACEELKTDVVKLLIHQGADVTSLDNSGKNCLHLAFTANDEEQAEVQDELAELVTLLIAEGVPCDVTDADGKRPQEYVHETLAGKFDPIFSTTNGQQQSISKPSQPPVESSSQSLPVGQGSHAPLSQTLPMGTTPPESDSQSLPVGPPLSDGTQQPFSQTLPVGSRPLGKNQKNQKNQEGPRSLDLTGERTGLATPKGQGEIIEQIIEQTPSDISPGRAEVKTREKPADGRPSEARDKRADERPPEEESDPDLCESCNEEPYRYRIEPCGHLLCGDCAPKPKAKKKRCAECGEVVKDVAPAR